MVPPRTPQTLRPRPVSRDATGRLLDRSGPGRRRSLPLFPFLAVLLPILLAGCGEGAPFPALAATVAQALPGMAAGSGTEGHAVGTDGRPLDADTGPVEITEPVHPVVAFLELPAADSATEARALDELDEGLSLWRGGDRRAGADQVDRALALLPTLADWRPLIRAELLAADGDTAGVRLALEEVDRAGAGELRALWGWSFRVEALESVGDSVKARRVALDEAAVLDAVHPEQAARARVRGGRLALALGDTTTAREHLTRALMGGEPEGPAARDAARRLDRLPGEIRDPETLEQLALALAADGAWAEARSHLETLLLHRTEGAPMGEVGPPHLRLALGRALAEMGRNGEAAAVLAPLAADVNGGFASAEALYLKGQGALAEGRTQEARTHFRTLLERDPEGGAALGEEGMLALLDRLGGRDGAAGRAPAVEDLFRAGVASPAGELAAVRHGTAYYLAGRYDAAVRHFEAYAAAARRSATRQQAAYWAALAHERGGDRERAREFLRQVHQENPLSFYGALAGERLEAPVLPGDLAAGPAAAASRPVPVRNAILRLRVHQRVPTSGSFVWELARLEAAFLDRGDEAYELAEALLDGGLPIQGVVMGRAIHTRNGEWDLRLLRIVHPFPWRDTIVREARSRGLDPFFVAGLIRQESLFHPTIRSSAGAVGLMQLMPGTGREVAMAEGLRYSPALLEDPEMNVRLGTAFLASMVRRFDGRAEDALAAYNAGPTRARQWRERPEYRNVDVFREHIPFRETRHYVKVVHQYTRIYTALYGCGDFEPCLGLSYQAALARSPHGGGIPSTAVAR